MSAPVLLPLEWAVFEVAPSGITTPYRVALVHDEDMAKSIARSLSRKASTGYRYYVEAVAS